MKMGQINEIRNPQWVSSSSGLKNHKLQISALQFKLSVLYEWKYSVLEMENLLRQTFGPQAWPSIYEEFVTK